MANDMDNLCEITGTRYVCLFPERFSVHKQFGKKNVTVPQELDDEFLQACGTIGIPYEENEISYTIHIMPIGNNKKKLSTIQLMEKVIFLDQEFPENINITLYVSRTIYREILECMRLSLCHGIAKYNFQFSFDYQTPSYLNFELNNSLANLLGSGEERQLEFECFSLEWGVLS